MKRVVVTGASGDLGTAVVSRAVASGAEVLAQFHTRPPAISHPSVVPVQVDLTHDDGPFGLVSALPWEGVDLLVNCIGGARPTPYAELSTAAFRDSMRLNVDVPFAVTRELLGPLAAATGAVVNLSSVVAFTGGAFGPHYAAGKAAVVGLTRSAARELGEWGIRVNCVAPGPVASAMTDSLPEDVLAGLLATTALRRVVTPDEVADAVFAIAAATGVTGQTLVVDGGRFLH
ncbi:MULTISPECIES: SDR family NAD(P)-dependent oxidoreductase [Streptomyces]|uniref:SDR family NAD(P)-dependent oxidoreductase n=1 Tax=Streptomyces TaxID=1883 RepID=UPI001E47440C|nr:MULTISPECIES: SDR family oxidoreductase [Streptomyces]UFQ19066.1 SDR family oxidoreductase [Streptomyces huasconensis]WCL88685.1 SDR family oxidoreductase [Streptomyces sp. JCM 35825]